MSEKISTVIVKVDLSCVHCEKKIKKVLCKYQDRWDVRGIAYDEKNDTVKLTGPFDPEKLMKNLCCKASEIIKDIYVGKDKPKPKDPKSKEKTKEDNSKQKLDDKPGVPVPGKIKEADTKLAKPDHGPTFYPYPYPLPIWLPGPSCACREWDEGQRPCSCGCSRGNRACGCHCGYGSDYEYRCSGGDPLPAYTGTGCHLVCEEGEWVYHVRG